MRFNFSLLRGLFTFVFFLASLRLYKPLALNISILEYIRSAHFENATVALAPSSFHKSDLSSLKQLLKSSADNYPQNDTVWLALGFIDFFQGHEEVSLSTWKNITNRNLLFNIALFYESLHDYVVSLKVYEHALPLSEGTIGLSLFHYKMGLIYHKSMSPPELNNAIFHYATAVKIGDFHPYDWYEVETYNFLGHIYFQQTKYGEAIENYEQSLQLNPLQYWTLVNYARALWKINDVTQAKQVLFQAIELDPLQTDAYLIFGRISKERNFIDDAIMAYKNVLDLEPENEEALKTLNELNKFQ